jgi:hypothetical protein
MNKQIEVFWHPEKGVGLENLIITENTDGITVDSTVIGSRNDENFRLHYRITCDDRFHVKEVQIELLGDSENRKLHLIADGNWSDENESPLPQISGCFEIDISATPFTNTIPIRRLQLTPESIAELQVAYIEIPSLKVTKVDQRYTCINEYLYKYEGLFRNFEANLPLDKDYLVLDYPETFRRIAHIT